MPDLRKKKRGPGGTTEEYAAMPMQRVKEYLTSPEELLPTWQVLLLGLLKVILLVAVMTTIHMLVKDEIKASVLKTTAEVRLIQQADAVFPSADGLTQKQLLTYELSACDTVSNVAMEIALDEGAEIKEYGVTYSDGTEGGIDQRLLEKSRVSFAFHQDLKKNSTARVDLEISKRISSPKEAMEPIKIQNIHVTGKSKNGDVLFTLAE